MGIFTQSKEDLRFRKLATLFCTLRVWFIHAPLPSMQCHRPSYVQKFYMSKTIPTGVSMLVSLPSEPSLGAYRIHLEWSAEYPLFSHGDLSFLMANHQRDQGKNSPDNSGCFVTSRTVPKVKNTKDIS